MLSNNVTSSWHMEMNRNNCIRSLRELKCQSHHKPVLKKSCAYKSAWRYHQDMGWRSHSLQGGDTSQCPVQRWPWRTIDKKKLPGNRTRGYGELWTRKFLRKSRSRVKACNVFPCEGRGSLLFLPGKTPYCCGPWLLSITILPFTQRKP